MICILDNENLILTKSLYNASGNGAISYKAESIILHFYNKLVNKFHIPNLLIHFHSNRPPFFTLLIHLIFIYSDSSISFPSICSIIPLIERMAKISITQCIKYTLPNTKIRRLLKISSEKLLNFYNKHLLAPSSLINKSPKLLVINLLIH